MIQSQGREPDREGPTVTVGVLSDTHGHLYPEVRQLLDGVDHIVHAGDVGSARVLAELQTMGPVTAVRGNSDLEAWALTLPARAELDLGGARILVSHVGSRPLPVAETAEQRSGGHVLTVVICGHTHLANIDRAAGVLYLNPGSAGPRRFGRPRTVARLTIAPALPGAPDGGACPRVTAEILAAEAD